MGAVIRLDTHVVAWLHAGLVERLSPAAVDAIEACDLVISPMVELELSYLCEIGRLSVPGGDIVADLGHRIGLRRSKLPMATVVAAASAMSWTRDPFDRVIAGDSVAAACPLLTKDDHLHLNVPAVIW